jgi:TusA-related sulfurtransferase
LAKEALRARIAELKVRCFAEFPDQEMFEIGVECSAVIVKLNDTLAGLPSGTVVHLVSDDPTSDIEVERWKGDTGNDLLDSLREGNLHHFVVRKK